MERLLSKWEYRSASSKWKLIGTSCGLNLVSSASFLNLFLIEHAQKQSVRLFFLRVLVKSIVTSSVTGHCSQMLFHWEKMLPTWKMNASQST